MKSGGNELIKKISVLAIFTVFSAALCAHAIVWVDTVGLNVSLGYGTGGVGDYSWQHETPADFEVPYDLVNSATLRINATQVDAYADTVSVDGQIVGTLVAGHEEVVESGFWFFGHYYSWSWTYWVDGGPTTLDIADTFVQWDNGDALNVSLHYVEPGFINALTLHDSTFTLDYDNGEAPDDTNAVPEPASLMLLATGLLGTFGISRKNSNG